MKCVHGVDFEKCDSCSESRDTRILPKGGSSTAPPRSERNAPSYHNLDIHRLDEEWLSQISMFREHAELLAEAQRDYKSAETELAVRKEELKEVSARLDLAIRKAPEAFGLGSIKVTEGVVDKTVLLQPDYTKAKDAVHAAMRKLNGAEYLRDIRKVAVDTVGGQRKPAIQDLVRLWFGSYFASPKLPRDDGGREMEEARHKAYGGRPRGSRNE